MRKLWQLARLATALSMLAILTACATSGGAPASTGVQIPRDCEDLAEQVPLPDLRLRASAKLSLAQHRAALVNADNNLGATRTCQARQRERFAKGG